MTEFCTRDNKATFTYLATSKQRLPTNEYADLKRLLKEDGVLEKQTAYYALKMALTAGMLAFGLAVLVLTNSFWLQLLNAVWLAFTFAQISFIVHDAGHRQIFVENWKNDLTGVICANLFLGASFSGWVSKHNQHHASPNQLDRDPDIDLASLAFTEEQAVNASGLGRFIARYQGFLFFPLLLLEPIAIRVTSIQFLRKTKEKHQALEALLMLVHFALYFGLFFFLMEPLKAMLLIVIHQGLYGVYVGSVFAPNHIGMPVLDKDAQVDFIRHQVLTARNLRANPFIDFWFGALNYQIEHHLFPNIARNKLKEAKKIVKAFCGSHSVSYRETGLLRSYWDALQYMHRVGAPLRRGKATLSPSPSEGRDFDVSSEIQQPTET